jgi:ABC-type phosphate transport system substrate-binding protein
MRRLLLAAFAACSLASLLPAGPALADGPGFKLIVHPSSPIASLPRDEVSKLFLRKTTSWAASDKPEPVDQIDGPLRQKFSQFVHQKSAGALKLYWQQQVFSGRASPPPEKANDAAVVEFVSGNAGGIGYVSEGAPTGSCKVVTVAP